MSEEEWTPTRRAARGSIEVREIGGRTDDPRGGAEKASGEEAGETPVQAEGAEDVVRLDQAPIPLASKHVDDAEPAAPVAEEPRKKGLGIRGLTVLMAVLAVVVAVAVVSAVLVFRAYQSQEDERVMMMDAGVDPIDEAEAIREAQEEMDSTHDLVAKAVDLLKIYSEAESYEDVIGLIRNGSELEPLLKQRWRPVGNFDGLKGSAGRSNGKPIISLTGKNTEGELFGFIFVGGEDGLKIDWESSMRLGDVDFDELTSVGVGETVQMRVVASPSNFHPVEFPDDKFRCFRVGDGVGSESVYGYAPVGSKVAQAMSEGLNEGAVLFQRGRDVAVILRLRNNGRGKFGQFVITEVLQVGWIKSLEKE